MADSKDPEKTPAKPGAAKTEMLSAPLDLDCEVGEGTMKEAYVPSDIAAARRAAEVLHASQKAAKEGGAGPIKVGSGDGTKVPGEDTDK